MIIFLVLKSAYLKLIQLLKLSFIMFAWFHSSLKAFNSWLKVSTLIFLHIIWHSVWGKQMHGSYFFFQVPVSKFQMVSALPLLLWWVQEKSLVCSLCFCCCRMEAINAPFGSIRLWMKLGALYYVLYLSLVRVDMWFVCLRIYFYIFKEENIRRNQ